ncbi:hypothetical protein EBZ38_03770 [bacterium]|nr:hypothetical protein [bacterium]
MRIKAILQRRGEKYGACFGELNIPQLGVRLYTLEDAWNGNKVGASCIPTGLYAVVPHGWDKASKVTRKRCWRLLDVPNRTAILIHAGNTVADTEGCVLVGTKAPVIDDVNGTVTLPQSKVAMDLLRAKIGEQGFQLEVKS